MCERARKASVRTQYLVKSNDKGNVKFSTFEHTVCNLLWTVCKILLWFYLQQIQLQLFQSNYIVRHTVFTAGYEKCVQKCVTLCPQPYIECTSHSVLLNTLNCAYNLQRFGTALGNTTRMCVSYLTLFLQPHIVCIWRDDMLIHVTFLCEYHATLLTALFCVYITQHFVYWQHFTVCISRDSVLFTSFCWPMRTRRRKNIFDTHIEIVKIRREIFDSVWHPHNKRSKNSKVSWCNTEPKWCLGKSECLKRRRKVSWHRPIS